VHGFKYFLKGILDISGFQMLHRALGCLMLGSPEAIRLKCLKII
jgi:hypothetical protein